MKSLLIHVCLIWLALTPEILAFIPLFRLGSSSGNIPSNPSKQSASTVKSSVQAQSPIDISNYVEKTCSAITYKLNYNNETTARFENAGHTVKVIMDGPDDEKPIISGGPLTGEYIMQEVHFHWGKNDSEGSEHTINGNRYPLEAHAVHYNTKYKNFQVASNYTDGLSVIGIVFDILPYRNSDFTEYENIMIDPLTSRLKDIPTNTSKLEDTAEELLKWFSPFVAKDHYFTYKGSLTTSPYSEVVTWIVYNAVIPLSEHQVEVFRKLKNPDGKCTKEHFRHVQPLNGRCVFYCSPNAETRCDHST
ncbi:hypothetical protein L9F63_022459 [Diploptera punctata]|uniref:Carbonic anhydrase n=1 Tax=Diploptera punctata TaxID=6984 RepID=A0AAD7ZME5_DIPPU|nr:hypothetical protein L9F63_022459 [Diploptera punctata]